MEQKIITAPSADELNRVIESQMKEGWKPVGGHTVATVHTENRFSGSQMRGSHNTMEYAQTMIRTNDKPELLTEEK